MAGFNPDRQRKHVAKVADDEEVTFDEVAWLNIQDRLTSKTDDPFAQEADDIRKYSGLSASTKRQVTRELQKFHRGSNGNERAESKKADDAFINGYDILDVVTPPYNLDYLAKLNEVSAPHYSAIKAKVANIVGLGYDFVESPDTRELLDKTEGEDKTQKLRRKLAKGKQDLLDWLDDCNQEDDFVETLIKVWTDYETTGNGYLEIGRRVDGAVGYIGHIPSTTMRVRRPRDGYVQIIGKNITFFRHFGLKTSDPIGNDSRPNEVIHLKKYAPTSNFYGVPDIVSAKGAIAGNEFSSRFNLDYFEHKAVPRYVVVVKGGNLSTTSKQSILEFFQTGLKGQNHRSLFVPLPADEEGRKASFEMKPVEAGIQDSSFNNYRKANLGEILMAHRVPISKVGLAEGVSLAVARDADKTFKEQVCRPEQRIFEKKLNRIIKEKTDVFLLKLNELSLTDEDTQSKIDERDLRWQTAVPNEIRARKGLPGLPGGDQPVGMMAMAELTANTSIKTTQMSGEQQAAAAATGAAASGASEAKTQATASRTRDSARSASSPDSSGEARQPKGEGRAQG
jgi:PBSX family phage portal protein